MLVSVFLRGIKMKSAFFKFNNSIISFIIIKDVWLGIKKTCNKLSSFNWDIVRVNQYDSSKKLY